MDVDLITQSQCFKCDEAEAAATADTDKPVQVPFRRQMTCKPHTNLLRLTDVMNSIFKCIIM